MKQKKKIKKHLLKKKAIHYSMGVLDYFLSLIFAVFIIGCFCYLFRFNLKSFTAFSLNSIAGFNLTLIFAGFGLMNLTGFNGFISSTLGPIGSVALLATTLVFG